jgi:hypothetical protein
MKQHKRPSPAVRPTKHAANVQRLQLERAKAAPPPVNPQPQLQAAQGARNNPSPAPGAPPDPGELI